jgi:hypothetical protein
MSLVLRRDRVSLRAVLAAHARAAIGDLPRTTAFMPRPFFRDTRHVSLARVLHARLYVSCEGRIFSAGGSVAHDKLHQTLARQCGWPTVANAPTPCDLGIAACDGELSQHLLHCIGRALNRWRKEQSLEMRHSPAKRRIATVLGRERDEIERLTSRLHDLREWHAQLAGGTTPPGAPYFLDTAAEASLEAALADAQCEHPLTSLIAWQARVVFWLSGNCATKRFLSATTRLLGACANDSCQRQVRSFQQAVIVWKKRSEQERAQDLRQEIAEHIKELPADIVCKGRLSAKLRGRTFPEHCDLLLKRCGELLLETQRQQWQFVPAALAALAAADGSATALPQRCLLRAIEQGGLADLLQTIKKLADQISLPGYDALLAGADHLPHSPDDPQFDVIRLLLWRGNSLADCIWACEQQLLHGLERSCLRVPATRRLGEAFAERGCPLDSDGLRSLVGRIQRPEALQPVYAWLRWLTSVSPRTITPRLREILDAVFWNTYLLSVESPGWFEKLAACLAGPRRTKDPHDYQPMLDRIAAYQQLAGRAGTLPKSVRKLLGMREDRRRELEALRVRRAAGTLEQVAQIRWQRLENVTFFLDATKIRRVAEEAFLLLGIESLTATIRQLALAGCRRQLGHLVERISPDRYRDFAHWLRAMSDSERSCLRELVTAHERHGRHHKRDLTENQDWINDALFHGVNLDVWFAPELERAEVGRRTMEIGMATDPLHIFLMGDYFHTCLSLGDCNEMSVLANAYDANKQVVFMFADDDISGRRVVARQLIAVSREFKLVGYCCYVCSRIRGQAEREEVVTAMASYCGRLAARCHLELSDHGSPQAIGDHFWYDDGEGAWHAAARAAWAECLQAAEALALVSC